MRVPLAIGLALAATLYSANKAAGCTVRWLAGFDVGSVNMAAIQALLDDDALWG